ncbi:MAG: Asp23/Gls24 family envelope stress response protein [Anaerolineae bacterium]|nr:Asp23/Gls24 family envelope stress response protein [Anaerolineae bacterium]
MIVQSDTVHGKVEVAATAIARVAGQAALRSYGVVGMSSPSLASDIAASLTRDPTRGVQITFRDEKLVIDMYIIIEYGTRISTVAQSLIDAVRYDVEKIVNIPVEQVNVHVQGLRVSDIDA